MTSAPIGLLSALDFQRLSMRFRFFKTALLIAFVMALLLVYPMYAWATPDVLKAVIAAGTIALVNVIVGAAVLEYSIDKSNGVFLSSTLGGMAIRMVLVLAVFTVLVLNGYNRMALTFALMSFYLIFMIAEIIYIARELSHRKSRSSAIAQRRSNSHHSAPRALSAEHRSN